MTMHLPRPRLWPRKPHPSPIPAAAAETNRLAAELNRVVEQLRRLNDAREAKRSE